MNKIIKDEAFISELKTKANAWVAEQSKSNASLPDIEIIEVTEYPVYNLIFKALVETRRVSKFQKPGAARPKSAQPGESPENIDPWSFNSEILREFTAGKQTVEIPSTIISIQCIKCDGTGISKCLECQGQKTVYCLQCRGDGKFPCDKCRRTLKINCPSCQGRGKVYSESTQKYENCSQCAGAGNYPCTECQNGFVICSACEGTGRTPCRACEEKGDMICAACEGKGNINSGTAVEIVTSVIEAKLEKKNHEIPESITGNELAFARFVPEMTTDIEAGKLPEGLPIVFAAVLTELEARLSFPPGGKVLRKAVSIEKKMFYNAVYNAAGAQNSAWFVISAGKFVGEKKLIQQLHAGTVDGLNDMMKKGDFAGAISLAKSVNHVAVLKSEAGRVKKEAEKKLSQPYIKGGLLGFAITLLAALPLSYYLWRHSYHLWSMEFYAVLCALASAALSTFFFIIIKPRLFNTDKKRLVGTAALAVIPVTAIFSVWIMFGIDPARHLDAGQMRAEYAAYFPFGLRTLVNKEDIQFLKDLMDKYSKTGIDLYSVTKDLKWLQDKQKSDEVNIAKIEKTSKAIEQITKDSEPVRHRRKRKTYKTLPKIYIN